MPHAVAYPSVVDSLGIIEMLINAFGVYAFWSIGLLTVRRWRTPHWGLGERTRNERASANLGTAILTVCFFWFVIGLTSSLVLSFPEARPALRILQTARLILSFVFPPLIMHVVYSENSAGSRRWWALPIFITYLASIATCLFSLLGFYDLIDTGEFNIGAFAGFSVGGLFSTCAIYCALLLSVGRADAESERERASRRSMLFMFGFMVVVTALLVLANVRDVGWERVLGLVGMSMPLAFIFVSMYHGDRFRFFDLLVKRGLGLTLTLGLLAAFFALTLPWLGSAELGAGRPFVYAIVLLPFAAALPALYNRLGQLLDNLWLGRSFTTVSAVKHFLAGLQRATHEADLTEQAQAGLATIFGAPVLVRLGSSPRAVEDPTPALEVPIGVAGVLGTVEMGRRANQRPYFSEDVELLGSLADVLSYMIENTRLQQKRREQEQQARELSLHASRSELKALRAQINPHFLFNALNAIAGLIHKDPARADQTVEQLAEVFRYTLRRSEDEWARLSDELEFVRAYLEVEQARFGKRLRFSVSMDEASTGARIPTMMVQTLVENAVKHGIASVRGPATIEVDAKLRGDRLRVQVIDNGPGFGNEEPSDHRGSGGYGLKNIRQRLAGYFAENASLTVERSGSDSLTTVSIEIPVDQGAS